jgi:hypothetical protein
LVGFAIQSLVTQKLCGTTGGRRISVRSCAGLFVLRRFANGVIS